MASQVESVLSSARGTSPKLPVIADGQSLVSQTPRQRTPTTREQAAQWALELRLRYSNVTCTSRKQNRFCKNKLIFLVLERSRKKMMKQDNVFMHLCSLEKKLAEDEKITEKEINLLKTELVAVIISALQKDE